MKFNSWISNKITRNWVICYQLVYHLVRLDCVVVCKLAIMQWMIWWLFKQPKAWPNILKNVFQVQMNWTKASFLAMMDDTTVNGKFYSNLNRFLFIYLFIRMGKYFTYIDEPLIVCFYFIIIFWIQICWAIGMRIFKRRYSGPFVQWNGGNTIHSICHFTYEFIGGCYGYSIT